MGNAVRLRQREACATCGAALRRVDDKSYVCPACGNPYDIETCAGLLDDIRDARASRLQADFERAERYC